ncbi:16S rRNA (cytidine(1402)-2'-O)-methyltransferase [Candidatus Nomurabacteria bacterium]|nr:16S rRNA (cytidine(1402)-2'-O)-methyltransferase [Candidatus Nomurabacteria bacterium]
MTLSVVATPIGNLKDISLRAKEVLTDATLIVAEDTRTTGQLLKLLGIEGKKEFFSSHAQSTESSLQRVLARCVEHEHIALVTDAGTPAISDPGSHFVAAFREYYPEAIIVAIPGPSAVIAALSVSGFPSSHFEFLGFIPHKKGRQTLFQSIADTEHTVVCYESPHRIVKTLESLAEVLGSRCMMVGREMTKQFEEYLSGNAAELLQHFIETPETVRGEFVIVISPKDSRDIL